MMTEKQAIEWGNRILKVMGPQWKLRVWNNLGWCFSVYSTYAAIYPVSWGPKTVYCMIGRDGTGLCAINGNTMWTDEDPRVVVTQVLRSAQGVVDGYQEMLTEVNAALQSTLSLAPSGPKRTKKPTNPKVGRKG